MKQYVIYLRKSRADSEAEARGEEETLARHEKSLLELARKLKLKVSDIYREVVSGETIAARPIMQKLLSEVEKGLWAGVLVMEVERLARGDTVDQGIMAQTFKYSETKIITPNKTYDPNDEFDEEYFEFGLFMSRREYKTINRRLQQGRLASVREGKYVANQPPYGYSRKKLLQEKGYTLEIISEQADIVRLIFEWYTKGELQTDHTYRRLGISLIAKKLNQLHLKPQKGDVWVTSSIRDILINPVYIGKIRWCWRPSTKKMVDGKLTKERPRSENAIVVDGLHEGIISEDIFYQAQHLMNSNRPLPVSQKGVLMNPLSGIVICGKCGRSMIRRPPSDKSKFDYLMCPAPNCTNVSVRLSSVENAILTALEKWLPSYRITIRPDSIKNNTIKIPIIKNQLHQNEISILDLQIQLNTVHDLLEKGVYTADQFLERSKLIAGKLEEYRVLQKTLYLEYDKEKVRSVENISSLPRTEHILSIYRSLHSPQTKNDMLKEFLEKVVYIKERSARYKGVDPDDFTITLYPILPKSP